MHIRTIRASLATAILLLGAAAAVAAEGKPAPKPTLSAPVKSKLKPVDINSAAKNELGFMLHIPEDLAAKIIAGRPYRTKAQLLTRGIVSADVYAQIKDKVIAKQSGPVR
ncbi:hypothetical protein [Geothrix sp. 21YS21S-4]|uniref:hypothetical protein n=1 Tax=Geothrix sp. 21YS21S-4 TaxID=3068889 RepID=UPI0027B8D5B4|nr:hypothetical protein [Geothrix sp. 21YS21S-4]